jgi:predicted nucleic acid-binding protein
MAVWIAATAFVLGVPLLTLDRDLAPLQDVMDLRVLT